MIPASEFYSVGTGPLQQGDILMAGVARLVAPDRFSPTPWDELDDAFTEVHPNGFQEGALIAAAGPALVMVTSHDCHFDKEWNRAVRRLIKTGIPEKDAWVEAEADIALDRTFNASPLVRAEDLTVDRGELLAGRVVGYLPVPGSGDGLVPDAVVDLTYRVTLDRLAIQRITSVSREVRAQLRYALARLDSLRSPEVGFRIEEVVGQRIMAVDFPKRDPLAVAFTLEDGSVMRLLQEPGDPAPGAARADSPPG